MALGDPINAMYGLGRNSTGPTNMNLGQRGAAGAWDGGYNATEQMPTPPSYSPPPAHHQTQVPPQSTAPVSAPPVATPAVPAAPPPMPTGGTWGDQAHLDYFRQYGAGNSGLSQEQVDTLLGGHSAPSQSTQDWNKTQQQFTQNNQGYAGSGYWGNADQVAAQRAGERQSAGIPTGVLDASFDKGGSNYGGQQTAGNTMSGQNGAMNWGGSTYGTRKQNGDAYSAWRGASQ